MPGTNDHGITTEIQELIRATEEQAAAEHDRALAVQEQNRLMQEQLELDRRDQRLRARQSRQINEALGWVRKIQDDHHDPIMAALEHLIKAIEALLEINRLIALRVTGREEHDRLQQILVSAMQRPVSITNEAVQVGNVDGDLSGTIAGRDVQ